jgi:FkbM family methyltransferase
VLVEGEPALRSRLDELLGEGVDAARAREQLRFDAVRSRGGGIVLHGAGGLGRRALPGLRASGIEPLAFTDNNPALWGQSVEGVTVVSPSDAAQRYGETATFIVTIWGALSRDRMRDRLAQLRAIGCMHVEPFSTLFWARPDGLLPHYGADLPHRVLERSNAVRSTFDLWADDASRLEYVNQVQWRLHMDFDALADPVDGPIYFPTDMYLRNADEVFVDCGAFDGDTIRLFLANSGDRFRAIYAFEPDPQNFALLRANVDKLERSVRERTTVYPFAVGAERGRVSFLAEGSKASAMGAGGLAVDCVRLDDVLSRAGVTFIKMDIEGIELEALEGAAAIIRRERPVLAISCYHAQDHLWSIPSLINSLVSDYEFYLRPHDIEMWDLICYAVPRNRRVARPQTNRA